MKSKIDIEKAVGQKLSILRSTDSRDPLRTQSGRNRFMEEARNLNLSVSPDDQPRLSKGKQKFQHLFPFANKETQRMTNLITSAIVILTLIFGGGGITVAAAQSSQPNSPLYEIKLLSEDVQLALTSDPDVQVQTALNFAARRLQEIQTLINDGQPIPAELAARYDLEVTQAIRYAMNQPDNEVGQTMTQIKTQLEIQARVLDQIQGKGSQQDQGVLLQTRDTVQERLQWVTTGLGDLTQLRDQLQIRDQLQTRIATSVLVGTSTPQPQGQQQGWVTGTPTPGSGYGPGPGPDPSVTCTPKDSNFDGTSTQNGQQGTQSNQGQGNSGQNGNK
ncbi:hypothetical protein SDC9_80418 [bioreactor metagenome]|uniref:DUF5667 domain-containing protein n=1 Tax=bioreactor metagenome TaxID=1076179 RepID=A0A644YZP5_9ZZZZ